MRINVQIDEVTLDSMVEQVYARGVRHTYDGPEETEPYRDGARTLGDLVADQIVAKVIADSDRYNELRRRVEAIRDEEIRRLVEPLVRAAVEQPVPRTNSFGEPTGTPTSIREMVLKAANAHMGNNVRLRDGSSTSQLQAWVAEIVAAEFKAFITAEVKVVKDAVSRSLATQATEAVTAVVQNALAGR